MASGWNLWVWLQCIGVASRCCYKEVYTVNPFISSSLYFSDLGITSSWTSLNFSVLLKQNLMNFLALYNENHKLSIY